MAVNLKHVLRGTLNRRETKGEELVSTTPDTLKIEDTPELVTQGTFPNWSNFFGIDLKKSPNKEWYELSRDTNPSGETIRNFRIYKGLGEHFTELEAKVIAKVATNFFLRAPYSSKIAFDIYYTIEKNFANPCITKDEAEDKFKCKFDSIYDSIHWDLGDSSIIMDRDLDTEEIKLGVWTHLYNADYLDAEEIDKSKIFPTHSWSEFLGFDLMKSPNSMWIESAGQINPSGDKIRNFRCKELKNTYFSKVEAKVIGKKATNFFFTAPYSEENTIDIYFNVERLSVHPNITKKEAGKNLKGQFDSIYSSIRWEFDDCTLIMDRDIDSEDIVLRVWTHLYNAEYLDTEKSFKEEDESSVENLDNNVKKITIQLPSGVATLIFLRRVLMKRMANTDENYGLTVEGDLINVYNLGTQEKVYQFENLMISRLVGNKLVAAMFQNINLDDIENPKLDIYIAFPKA